MSFTYNIHVNGRDCTDIFDIQTHTERFKNLYKTSPFENLYRNNTIMNSLLNSYSDSHIENAPGYNLFDDFNIKYILEAEDLFFQLDFIESIKHSKCLIEIRPLIFNYSINGFDLSTLLNNLTTNKEKQNIPLVVDTPFFDNSGVFEGTNIKFDKSVVYDRSYGYRKSENHVKSHNGISDDSRSIPNSFLEHMHSVRNTYNPFDIISNANEEKYISNRHYRTLFQQTPEMLLLYCYYSGRTYDDSNTSGRPHTYSTDANKGSINAYKQVYNSMNKCFKKSAKFSNHLNIIHLYRLEKIFHYNHIIQLNHMYQFFTSSECLNHLATKSFKKFENIDVANVVNSTLFGDTKFIRHLMSPQVINPSVFVYHLYQKHFVELRTVYPEYDTLKELLTKIKEEVINYITLLPEYLSLDSIVFKDDYHIDIIASEHNILNKIQENKTACRFITNNFSFDEINKALNDMSEFLKYDSLKEIILNGWSR